MFPTLTTYNTSDCSEMNTKCHSYFVVRSTVIVLLSYFKNLLLRKLSIPVPISATNHPRFTFRPMGLSNLTEPTLGDCVFDILALSSEKQMIRTNAGRIVTFVENLKTRRNRAIRHFVGCAMGLNRLPVFVNNPVPVCCFPNPASVSLNDVAPKAFFKRSSHRNPKALTTAILATSLLLFKTGLANWANDHFKRLPWGDFTFRSFYRHVQPFFSRLTCLGRAWRQQPLARLYSNPLTTVGQTTHT
jgi:hypothetical protein